MSQLDPRSKMLCGLCGELFHEPDMAAYPGYDFRRTTVSDAHRLQYHSGDTTKRNYDPLYYTAAMRAQSIQDANADHDYQASIEGWRRMRRALRPTNDAKLEEP